MKEAWGLDGMTVDGDVKAAIVEIDGCKRVLRRGSSFNSSGRVDNALNLGCKQ